MIRRNKEILKLPSREDKIVKLSFDYLERKHYCQIERSVVEILNQASGEETNSGKLWLNVMQQINQLRFVCNLGPFVPSLQRSPIQSRGSDRTPAVLDARVSIGGETCGQCLQPVDSSPPGTGLEGSAPSVYYSTCHRLFCASCSILSRYQAPEPCV